MIQLHPDYLIIQTAEGETIPCSAELVTVELIGDSASALQPDLIRQVAAAVLHYFKHDLGRSVVSVREFSQALERVLTGLGYTVESAENAAPAGPVADSDLGALADAPGVAFELAFFSSLRQELRRGLRNSPRLLRFHGLRGCVKQLAGAKRWSSRCQRLSDQIVLFVRHCLAVEDRGERCSVLIR